jgi:uncharacterized damage-inducible protein DinB
MQSGDPETRKADMLDRIRTAHARLEQALAALTTEQIEAQEMVGGWSVKTTLGHITWWEQVPIHAFRDEPVENLLPGEEWDTDRANAVLVARNHIRPLNEVRAAFHASYAELLGALEALPATRLDEPCPYGSSLFELIAGNTYAHYDEHATLIAAAFGLALPQTVEGIEQESAHLL